ncbi:HAMP domain-containing histidine kinase [Elioraea sp. Yellowstone]|jgi:signal transduction histidine kinase|uniref:sensor histidine kinase n=1 Tax=Elioraea sp. Yellowstone TaxID=2592070 RepID=UPI0011546E3F|nr:HAMP domain-containing sensor histidine kinase [Elioraea sp. Yellowstone]TQF82042.1 HAMP domain-containing histidine kinase [Elioraea sp. Yellowstone]
MADRRPDVPRPARSLSIRLLWLTMGFVMVAQALILVPSLGRAYLDWLGTRIEASHLAALALEAAPDQILGEELEDRLLRLAGVEVVSLRKPDQRVLALARPLEGPIVRTVDLDAISLPRAAADVLEILVMPKTGLMRVIGPSAKEPGTLVDIVMRSGALKRDMHVALVRILAEALAISLVAGVLLFLALHWLLVRPMRRLTGSIVAFRRDPEAAPPPPATPPRDDEIGRAQSELAAMQEELRRALWQKSRLAALGTAVTKINHDMRGILATALLISDRLTTSEDPKVRQMAPTLLAAIERAVALCKQTLDYAREGPPPLDLRRFALASLVDEAARAAEPYPREGPAGVENRVPRTIELYADREQLFRVLLNLFRNAFEAGARRVTVTAEPGEVVAITVADDGPGLPAKVREALFSPFTSGRRGGTGLGLAIARDVMRTHGGDIALERTGPEGTVFRLTLPGESPMEPAPVEVATAPRGAAPVQPSPARDQAAP